MNDTPFTESNALLAVVRGDLDEAQRIIATMTPGEQRLLSEQSDKLAYLCRRPGCIREALSGGCRWNYRCTNPVVAYYGISQMGSGKYDDFRGICATCRPDAEAAEITTYDPPVEVTL